MLTKSKAIVLNSVRYGDNKVFVNVFSDEYGMVTVSYSLSLRNRKSSMSNYMQPLNIIEIEMDYRSTTQIHKLRGARMYYPTTSIHADAYKISISIFLAEVLRYALANEQKNPFLFQFIEQSIEWLDTATCNFANFHIVFLTRLTSLLGFRPNIETFVPGYRFDLREGGFISNILNKEYLLSAEDSKLIPVLMRLNYNTMRLLRINRKERNSCTETLLLYYKLHTPNFPEIRSLDVMKQLF